MNKVVEAEKTSKNIIITGASKGIGYACALSFAKKGHKVLAIARNSELLKKLQEEGKGYIYIKECDIMDFQLNMLPSSFDEIDILLNNAGYLIKKPFLDITQEELNDVYRTNVFAPFLITQKLFEVFNKRAHIINIGSAGGINGTQKFPGLSIYSSSKAAVSCLSECLQAEFADTDMTFNSIALGSVQTEMLEAAFPGYTAATSPSEMAEYITEFALYAHRVLKGKTHLVSSSNP